MSSKIVIIVLNILLLLKSYSRANELYPTWFLFPKNFPGLIVGYSFNFNSACEDALKRFVVYKSCIVEGQLELFEDESSTNWFKNSEYYYYFFEESLLYAKNNFKCIDSFITNVLLGDYIVACTNSEINFEQSTYLKTSDLRVPDWIDKNIWEEDNYYYSVGFYTSEKNENDAWMTAEEKAIFNLITNLAIKYYQLKVLKETEKREKIKFQKISFIKVKHYLRNISVLERYPDMLNKLVYVLIRINKNDIISPYFK